MKLIGLMSGTSADGIDAALVEITGEGRQTRISLIHFLCVPHTAEMRDAILGLSDKKGRYTPDLCALHWALGERFGEAAQAVAQEAGVPMAEIDAVCSHGQTLWHQPKPRIIGKMAVRGTLQLGEPAVIAARTGRPVVANFRAADMAAGGQGAPLVPYADWALLTSDRESRAVLNIGGIANVTHLPRAATREEVIAFDTGPGNMVIDGLASIFTIGQRTRDDGGAWAAKGKPNENVVAHLLEHPFFSKPPPKSTGREMFGWEYVEAVREFKSQDRKAGADLMATVTLLTAESIARAFQDFLAPRGGAQTVIVGGGGTHNRTLMRMLAERLAPARLTTHAEFGIPDDAKEAMAFALLGYETLHGRPSNMPGATGAKRPVVLGSVTPAPYAPLPE